MEWFHKRKQTKKQKFDEEIKAKGGIVDPLNPSRRGFMSMAGTAAIGAMGVAGANTLIALNNGAKADGEPIPVGAMLPYTGWGAEDSRNFEAGITLAVEEINSYGGIHGRPIEVHYEDTKEITAETVTSAARRLIDRHEVHAIINGYNSLSVRAEYDTIADAGIPYMHDNTQYGHQFAVRDNPDRYWCIFQDDPSEYYYGSGLIYFLDELEKLGKWKRPNNKFVLFSGSIDYAITIAAAVRDTAPQFGWELAIDDVVTQPVDDWGRRWCVRGKPTPQSSRRLMDSRPIRPVWSQASPRTRPTAWSTCSTRCSSGPSSTSSRRPAKACSARPPSVPCRTRSATPSRERSAIGGART